MRKWQREPIESRNFVRELWGRTPVMYTKFMYTSSYYVSLHAAIPLQIRIS